MNFEQSSEILTLHTKREQFRHVGIRAPSASECGKQLKKSSFGLHLAPALLCLQSYAYDLQQGRDAMDRLPFSLVLNGRSHDVQVHRKSRSVEAFFV